MPESGARTEGKGPRLVLVRGILKVQAKSQRIIGNEISDYSNSS